MMMELCPECGSETKIAYNGFEYCPSCDWWSGKLTVAIDDVPMEALDVPDLPETPAETIERLTAANAANLEYIAAIKARVAELERALETAKAEELRIHGAEAVRHGRIRDE